MPRPRSALATLINKEKSDNHPEFKLWDEVIELAWLDATIFNKPDAQKFFWQRDAVFHDVCEMWGLNADAIREQLTKVIADKRLQKHIDGRKYARRHRNKKQQQIATMNWTTNINQLTTGKTV